LYPVSLDTRSKIVSAGQVAGGGKALKVIIGYFDPLHAAQTRKLRSVGSAGECLVVAVDDPASPLLPLRARQELVAGLDCVDFVVAASELEELAADVIIDDRKADQLRTTSLVAKVVAKHAF
jgi:bifunctional ADP-heptose synthase (sugar kinase/adenylyltransferase)